MKNSLPPLLALFFSLLLGAHVAQAVELTPSDVYAQAVRIEQEIGTLKRHLKITASPKVEPKSGELNPRFTWAESYVILLKLSKLRRKLGLPYIEPVNMVPQLEMPSNLSWEMTQRILTEIALIKRHLNITAPMPAAPLIAGKRPIDNYNKLNQISGELEWLAGAVTPSEVYSQVKRLHDDVDGILRQQNRVDIGVPPPRRENLQPKDSLQAVFRVMGEIQRLQRAHGLKVTDFKGFDMGEKTVPDDVYGMVALALIEFQQVKAQLGLTDTLPSPAIYVENKTPADVVQLLGYITDKLRTIK